MNSNVHLPVKKKLTDGQVLSGPSVGAVWWARIVVGTLNLKRWQPKRFERSMGCRRMVSTWWKWTSQKKKGGREIRAGDPQEEVPTGLIQSGRGNRGDGLFASIKLIGKAVGALVGCNGGNHKRFEQRISYASHQWFVSIQRMDMKISLTPVVSANTPSFEKQSFFGSSVC